MWNCLDPQVEFSDLAFEKITGEDVRAMWQWFCTKSKTRNGQAVGVPDFKVTKAEDAEVQARYEVDYTLTEGDKPHRHVRYEIESKFTLRNGKIVRHTDTPTISTFRFAWMAVGFPKCLAALTPWFKPKLRKQMLAKLAASKNTAQGQNAANSA
jgi:hypothetical protein